MRRPFYRKSPKDSPSVTWQVSSLPDLRERILNKILLGTLIVGAIALIPNMIVDIRRGDWGIITLYGVCFLGGLFLALNKKVSFRFRSASFLFFLYLLGFSATLTDGIAGNGRIWFLGFVILCGVLLGLKIAIFSLSLSLGTYLVIGSLMLGGIIAAPQAVSLPSSGIFMNWLSTGFVYLLTAVTIIVPLSIVIRDLSNSLEKERGLLDELSKERETLYRRTNELDRRLVQMRTAAQISRSISSVLDQSSLLRSVVDLVRERFNLYYVGVFLLDDKEEYAVLRAGTGEAGQKMVAEGHKLPVGGSSMIGWTIAHRQPRITLDTDDESVIFTNPLLPKTRSEIALPLTSGEKIFGAITVQSGKLKAFDEDDIIVLQGIADSLATALQNAQLFQKEEESLEEIRILSRQYLSNAWEKVGMNPDFSRYSYNNYEVTLSDENTSELNIPITLREQVIGQINLELSSLELASEDHVFIEQVTNQAALALENARLLDETQRRATRERLVTEIVKKARISADLDTILRTTLGELGRSMQAAEGLIYLEVPEKTTTSQLDGSDV